MAAGFISIRICDIIAKFHSITRRTRSITMDRRTAAGGRKTFSVFDTVIGIPPPFRCSAGMPPGADTVSLSLCAGLGADQTVPHCIQRLVGEVIVEQFFRSSRRLGFFPE